MASQHPEIIDLIDSDSDTEDNDETLIEGTTVTGRTSRTIKDAVKQEEEEEEEEDHHTEVAAATTTISSTEVAVDNSSLSSPHDRSAPAAASACTLITKHAVAAVATSTAAANSSPIVMMGSIKLENGDTGNAGEDQIDTITTATTTSDETSYHDKETDESVLNGISDANNDANTSTIAGTFIKEEEKMEKAVQEDGDKNDNDVDDNDDNDNGDDDDDDDDDNSNSRGNNDGNGNNICVHPKSDDVLFGKGNHHRPGNRCMLDAVNEHLMTFYSSSSSDKRRLIIEGIVTKVHDQGGRFLRRKDDGDDDDIDDGVDKRWVVVTKKETVETIRCAFHGRKSHNKSKIAQDDNEEEEEEEDEGDPTNEDILFGREKSSTCHPGNQRLLKMAIEKATDYRKATVEEKHSIIGDLFTTISNSGGRFLRKRIDDDISENTSILRWTEVSIQEAEAKIRKMIAKIRSHGTVTITDAFTHSAATILDTQCVVPQTTTDYITSRSIYNPRKQDVLFGKTGGSLFRSHPGNRKLLQLVRENLAEYTKSTPRGKKRCSIIEKLSDNICHGGGRFLQRNINDNISVPWWTEISKDEANKKVRNLIQGRIKSQIKGENDDDEEEEEETTGNEYEKLNVVIKLLRRFHLFVSHFHNPVDFSNPKLKVKYFKMVTIHFKDIRQRINNRHYTDVYDAYTDMCKMFDNFIYFYSNEGNGSSKHTAVISFGSHVYNFFKQLWQEYMIPSKSSEKYLKLVQERTMNRKKRSTSSSRIFMDTDCLKCAAKSINYLIDNGGRVDDLDNHPIWGMDISSDSNTAIIDGIVENLKQLENDLQKSISQKKRMSVSTFESNVRSIYTQENEHHIADQIERYIGKLTVPLHEEYCRGSFSSSIWGSIGSVVWARVSQKSTFWPSLILGMIAPGDEQEISYSSLTERNECRLPFNYKVELDKRKEKGVADGHSYFLIEFLGGHAFYWISRKNIIQTFDASENPNKNKKSDVYSPLYSDAVDEATEVLIEHVINQEGIMVTTAATGRSGIADNNDGKADYTSVATNVDAKITGNTNATENDKKEHTLKSKRPADWEGIPNERLPRDRTWPEGWIKRIYARRNGKAQDRYWYSPEGNKFRSLTEVAKFLENSDKDTDSTKTASPTENRSNHSLRAVITPVSAAMSTREQRSIFRQTKRNTGVDDSRESEVAGEVLPNDKTTYNATSTKRKAEQKQDVASKRFKCNEGTAESPRMSLTATKSTCSNTVEAHVDTDVFVDPVLMEFVVKNKDCFKVPPEIFHKWLVEKWGVHSMPYLDEACQEEDFVFSAMWNGGGLKPFKKKKFITAVIDSTMGAGTDSLTSYYASSTYNSIITAMHTGPKEGKTGHD